MTYKHKNKIKSHTYVFSNDNICPLILKRHIYTFHISFICRIIFNAHVHVMYYKQPGRLQPTTSYHTVLGFPILARVTAHNFSKIWFHPCAYLCMFISNGLTSPKWSPARPTPRLKLSRVQVHRITIFSILLKMGLCADTKYVQSVSFSIFYFTSVLLKSGVIFSGITLIFFGITLIKTSVRRLIGDVDQVKFRHVGVLQRNS